MRKALGWMFNNWSIKAGHKCTNVVRKLYGSMRNTSNWIVLHDAAMTMEMIAVYWQNATQEIYVEVFF